MLPAVGLRCASCKGAVESGVISNLSNGEGVGFLPLTTGSLRDDEFGAMFRSIYADKWNQFKANLCSSYEFKDLGDLKQFLGVRVIRDRPNRKLCNASVVSRFFF
jgi:hypothetical protein